MITFTKLGQYGRLGNQLFQYAALKSAALRNQLDCKIPNPNKQNWHGQQCMLTNFNIEVSYLNDSDYNSLKHYISDEHILNGTYVPILNNVSDNTDLCGFFQNTKYFEDYKKQIIYELTPKKELLEKSLLKINKFKKKRKLVSLHIRRGDQTDGTNSYYNKYYGTGPFDTKCLVGKYIVESLSYFNDCDVLVFTGGSRSGNDIEDIRWAKTYFTDQKFIVSETNSAMQDFVLMSLCDHNIISFASSFGWWAAYINQNPDKIVIAPQDYHLDGDYIKRDGFYPKNWKLL